MDVADSRTRLIACCGLDCATCDARVATINDDDELREKTAHKWSEMNNAPEITSETINCMGCREDGKKFAYCEYYCRIRKCVFGKGFETCGECVAMDICPLVGSVFQYNSLAKENLISIK